LQTLSFAFGIMLKAPSFVFSADLFCVFFWLHTSRFGSLKADHLFLRRDLEEHTFYQLHNFQTSGVNVSKSEQYVSCHAQVVCTMDRCWENRSLRFDLRMKLGGCYVTIWTNVKIARELTMVYPKVSVLNR
jgi:hypothetical protein